MRPYHIEISKSAAKQLDKLPNDISSNIIKTIRELSKQPRPAGFKKLKGRNAYRIRKGSYRVIYEINDGILTIQIIALGHRKNIYK